MPRVRILVATICLLGCSAFLQGCLDSRKTVDVEQPLQFDHSKHIRYFLNDAHKAENIIWHLEELGEDEAPEELLDGKCLECHDTLEDKPNCGPCHIIFQDENAKKNRTRRSCLACHQNAWTGYQAGIPSIEVCKSCHGEIPRTTSDKEKKLREYIDAGKDIPWVQINTYTEHVHFSHIAHVRFAGLSCRDCHPQDMTKLSEPPNQVLVLSMSACIDCHQQRQAIYDCLACHK